MDSKLTKVNQEPEYRKGKTVNMDKYLAEMDDMYMIELNATVKTFDTYDEVSNETYNDYKEVCAELKALFLLGYIDDFEYKALINTALDMRKKVLEELEGKNGSNISNNA